MPRKRYAVVGQVIKRLREKAGLTPHALAEKAGLHNQTVYALEGNERGRTSLEIVRRLAAALDVTVQDIVDQLPPLKPPPG